MKKAVVIIAIISLFMLSGCDVYNTLYVKQPSLEGTDLVNESEIVIVDTSELENPVEEEINVDLEEETPSEDATVIILQETQKVNLQPKAEDPDNDVITYAFTNPLDENGQWQTTYGDAGEYTVTVTASDGTLTASKQALIIIQRKEESPVIDQAMPQENTVDAKETDSISFELQASDLNKDALTYNWKLDGGDVGSSEGYTYQTGYDDSGSHTVKASVSDGTSNAERIWALTIANTNRVPSMEHINDITAKETDTIVIEVVASDEDGDELVFSVSDGRFGQDQNAFSWETGYDDAGQYTLTISASDGTDETSQEITITVENVNRPPTILDIVQNGS